MQHDYSSIRLALEAIVALPHGPQRAALVAQLAGSHAAILIAGASEKG